MKAGGTSVTFASAVCNGLGLNVNAPACLDVNFIDSTKDLALTTRSCISLLLPPYP